MTEAQPGGSADHAAAHFAGFMPPAPEQQQLQQPAVVSATEAEAAAAAAAVTAAAAAVTAAAVEASEMTTAAAGAGASASLQPVQHAKAEQLSYAAIREAAAVNQAADGAADEAMQTVAAAQQTLHMLMNPTPMTMQQHGMAGMEDDTSASTHHPSGRARRSRSSTGYMDHQGAAHLMGMAGGMYVPGGRPNKGLRHFSMKVSVGRRWRAVSCAIYREGMRGITYQLLTAMGFNATGGVSMWRLKLTRKQVPNSRVCRLPKYLPQSQQG